MNAVPRRVPPRTRQGTVAGPRGGPGAAPHHVTTSYDVDADKMLEVLRIGGEELSDKGTRSAEKRVGPPRAADRSAARGGHRPEWVARVS
ncbi:hypothetical protein [Streptomyces sp. NPDC096105]|uniref:hypothetical protein n=1 Tax=Streptomyces sp. NPDC096105 TaxID=3366074 RepID=UPI003827486F